MLVVGLTVCEEDARFETAIQDFCGGPAERITREHDLKTQERRRQAAAAYQRLVGPETRNYENLQMGALAAYLVSRGLDDRAEQVSRSHELVNNRLNATIFNRCVVLTLESSEYLTIASAQNRGIRLVDADSINGINDPVYDAIISSELDPVEYIAGLNEIDATIYHFPQMVDTFDHVSMGAAAGS